MSKYTICVYSVLDPPTNGNEEQEKSYVCYILVLVPWVGGGGGGLVGPQVSLCKNEDHEFSLYLFMNKVRKI